jgi:hypothetical protein
MRDTLNLLLLTAALALATVVAGWWAVPVVAGVWTFVAPRRGAVLYAAAAGAFAWGALLVWYGRSAPVGGVDALLTQLLSVPANSFTALTLVYAALLAGSAALVAQSFRAPAPIRSRSSRRSTSG